MSDEREGSDAAADGGETENTAEPGSRTAVAARPQRPTGKRARQHGSDEAGGARGEQEADDEGGDDKSSDKPAKAEKAKKQSGPAANPLVHVYNYLKQVVAELRKVIWPNRKQMITYTSVVLVFLVFMVTLIGGADVGFAKLVMLVFGE